MISKKVTPAKEPKKALTKEQRDEILDELLKEVDKRLTKRDKAPTIVHFVLDSSSSMSSIASTVVSSFNEYMDGLQSKKENFLITVTPFNNKVLPNIYSSAQIKGVERMTMKDYQPFGNTALYDAIAHALAETEDERRKAEQEYDSPVNVLFVIITDGQENSSRDYQKKDIKRLIERSERTDRYAFIYLGANHDAWEEGFGLGINSGNAFCFTATASGFRGVGQNMMATTDSYMAHVERGGGGSSFQASLDSKPTIKEA